MENKRDSISPSFSYDGYEQLHDDAMDKISVSIRYSDEAFNVNSRNNLAQITEKKMKISLSQEQVKLANGSKNFLTIPKSSRRARCSSFSSIAKSVDVVSIGSENQEVRKPFEDLNAIQTLPIIETINASDDDEVIYAVPSRCLKKENEKAAPSAALLLSKSVKITQTPFSTSEEGAKSSNKSFKYPLYFYCKICNCILNDPRTLDCLHSFCMQCLAKLDASNDLQNNLFWRKISDSSFQASSSMESEKQIPKPKFSFVRSSKTMKHIKDKSPTRNVRGRHSSIISFSEKPKSIICPTCGLTTEMTIHGVFRLPQNSMLARKIRSSIGNIKEPFDACQLCSIGIAATATCVTCTFNLCNSCKEIHKRHTASHEFKNLDKKPKKRFEKSPVKDSAIKCLIHYNNDLKLFCTSCCQIICSECTILIHRGHKMTSVLKAAKIYVETLKEAKDNTKPLSVYAIHSISKLNDISKKINQKCDAVERDVETYLAEYFQALEVHKTTLLNQIARCRETKMDMIHCQQLDLERRSNEAKTAITFTESLLAEGTDEESLLFLNLLLKKFDSCRSSDRAMDVKITDSLQFMPEVKAPPNQKNIPLYGIITTQVAVGRNCSLESMTGLMNLRVNKKAELTLQTRDIEDRAMCHGSAEVDVTVSYRDVAFKTVAVQVTDKRDGTYIISFIPDSPGIIKISILVNGKQIEDGPFTARSRNLRPHSGIFHCCSFCSSNGKKVCACGGMMEVDGYVGCGHGHQGWAGRRHWSCCASTLENSECSVANAISAEHLPE